MIPIIRIRRYGPSYLYNRQRFTHKDGFHFETGPGANVEMTVHRTQHRWIKFNCVPDSFRDSHPFSKHLEIHLWRHQMETCPFYWPFVRGMHRSPVNYPHKGRWWGDLILFFHLRLNERLSNQSWVWRFEALSRSLWRPCNAFPKTLCSVNHSPWPELQALFTICNLCVLDNATLIIQVYFHGTGTIIGLS